MIVVNWGIIICLFVLTVISCILVIGDARVFSDGVATTSASVTGTVVRGGVRLSRGGGRRPPPPPLAPLRWDDDEGAYMVNLTVGLGGVELVLDTGSSQLSVKGSGCQWRQCDGQSCNLVSCPCGVDARGKPRLDCREHYYQPKGTRLQPGEMGAGMNTVMTYGSQVDTIEHYADTVSLQTTVSSCDELLSVAPDRLGSTMTPASAHRPVIVHRVLHIDGSSSSNLLGLSRPNKGTVEHGSRVLLESLLDGDVWGVVLMGDTGWLVFGALPCFASPPHYVPLLQPRAFSGFLTSFYIVEVQSVWVGASPSQLRELPSTAAPKWCIVDTGTTFTYGSPRLGAGLDAVGYTETGSVLQLRLGSKKSPLVLTYTPQQLADPDSPQHSIIQAWPGRTLDDYDSIFPPSAGGVLLLGALMMNNSYWEFDLGNNRMGVTPLPTRLPGPRTA